MTVQITVAGPLAEALHAVYRMGTVLNIESHGEVDRDPDLGVDAIRITATSTPNPEPANLAAGHSTTPRPPSRR